MTDASGLEEVLTHGELEITGRLAGASNATLQAVCSLGGASVTCVYKPSRGERPLWDFPDGSLGHREVAAYLVARDLGWDLIPLTVWRADGPYGQGMCQAWVDEDELHAPVDVVDLGSLAAGWCTVAEGEGPDGRPVALVHEDSDALRRLSLLDVVINNADRKGGHVLRRPDGGLAGIDHGLTFHEEPKLRTVLWGWAGEPIGVEDAASLERASRRWSDGADLALLADHLGRREVQRTRQRLAALIASGRHPLPDGMWPALPWPAM